MQITISGRTIRDAVVVLLAVVGVAAIALGVLRQFSAGDGFAGRIDEDRYQAVVLSDGRIFFGHLRSISDEYLELSDAHFVDQAEATGEAPATQRVVPITDRLEGPESAMLLNKEYVVAVENLRADSEIVEAIEEVRAARG